MKGDGIVDGRKVGPQITRWPRLKLAYHEDIHLNGAAPAFIGDREVGFYAGGKRDADGRHVLFIALDPDAVREALESP